MSYYLSGKSVENLEGVHHDLRAVVFKAILLSKVDFSVTCGVRSDADQIELYHAGASHTLNSRHLPRRPKKGGDPVSHAIDVAAYVNGEVRWDWPLYYEINKAFEEAAEELGVDIDWGGHWPADRADGPHQQLSWQSYPV